MCAFLKSLLIDECLEVSSVPFLISRIRGCWASVVLQVLRYSKHKFYETKKSVSNDVLTFANSTFVRNFHPL